MKKYMKFTMFKKETEDKTYRDDPYRAVNFSSMQELFDYHDSIENQIKALEAERQAIRNRIRRCDNAEEKTDLKQQAKDITKQLTPLRKQNKITDRIERRAPELQRMLILERGLEIQAYKQQLNKNYDRSR